MKEQVTYTVSAAPVLLTMYDIDHITASRGPTGNEDCRETENEDSERQASILSLSVGGFIETVPLEQAWGSRC